MDQDEEVKDESKNNTTKKVCHAEILFSLRGLDGLFDDVVPAGVR